MSEHWTGPDKVAESVSDKDKGKKEKIEKSCLSQTHRQRKN